MPQRCGAVLAVDDSPTIRHVLGTVLHACGVDVISACDGAAALELAGVNEISMVITDNQMPRMNGLTLLRALRALPKYQDTPIYILSSDGESSQRLESIAAGASGWISKPFTPAAIAQLVAAQNF